MALGTFAAGAYVGTIDPPGAGGPFDMGLTERGWTFSWEFPEELLNKSDRFGNSVIETFSQGCNVNLAGVFHEYKTGTMRAVNPMNAFAAGVGAQTFDFPTVGQAGTDKASLVVLTAQAGNLAAANGPASITFPQAKASQDSVAMLFGPEHRTLVYNAIVIPYNDGGTVRYASAT